MALSRCSSAAPRMMWAFVPLMPKELTPAYRPPSVGAQGWRSCGRVIPVSSRSILGFRVVKWTSGGTVRRRRQRITLSSPAMPAAASRWPMFVFTEPTRSRAPPLRWPSARTSASISIGSPSAVPVPCASTRPMSAAVRPASASAASTREIWASTFGAVNPDERPSELTAEPWITAWIRSQSRTAWSRRLSTTTPHPSPRVKPLARASKDLHNPSGASERVWTTSRVERGDRMRLTPPASATSHSPRRSAWLARWTATSDDEHAVSIATAGPVSPIV